MSARVCEDEGELQGHATEHPLVRPIGDERARVKGIQVDQMTSEQAGWIIGCVLYCLICGGFGCYVAMAKNREWYEGMIFGLLLGPLGVIAAACLPTIASKLNPADIPRQRRPRDEEEEKELDVEQLTERLRRAPAVADPRKIFPHVS
jgi:hypothetical protein